MALPCRFQSGGRWYDGTIRDLSEVGAFIETGDPLAAGSHATVSIEAAGQETEIRGVVKHAGVYSHRFSEVPGFGLGFEDQPAERIRQLARRYHVQVPPAGDFPRKIRIGPSPWLRRLSEVNKEVWLVLSLILISGLANLIVASNQMVLSFYTFPTLFSAFFYGRRHATLTALASVLLVVLTIFFGEPFGLPTLARSRWVDITVWGGTLVIIGYATGSLYERVKARLVELRQTYNGILIILQYFVAKDKFTENHSYRVSQYATRIAREIGLDSERIEDVRAAALLHDIGKLDISREILHKASRLSEDEMMEMKQHVERGVGLLQPVGGALRRIIPIILSHHDRYDGSGYHPQRGDEIPIEAKIIAVADVYDAVTSDRPYRKAMSPFEAKDMIEKAAGSEFDPLVVAAFLAVFRRGGLEIAQIVV